MICKLNLRLRMHARMVCAIRTALGFTSVVCCSIRSITGKGHRNCARRCSSRISRYIVPALCIWVAILYRAVYVCRTASGQPQIADVAEKCGTPRVAAMTDSSARRRSKQVSTDYIYVNLHQLYAQPFLSHWASAGSFARAA